MAEKIKPTQEAKLNRKGNKPQMEKRRRARINHHLEQLAGLLFEGRKKDSNRHSKLEKADILEMTVRHVKDLQNRLSITSDPNIHSMNSEPNVHSRYRIGYTECASEVKRYLNSAESIDESVRNRIADHLANSIPVTGTVVNRQQDSKPFSRLENNQENNNENTPENVTQKPEAPVKLELLSPVGSTTSPSPPNVSPMKSLQVTIPNSLNLSRISIPVLGSTNKTLLSPQTAAISIGDNFPNLDSQTRPEISKPQSLVVTSIPNLSGTPKTSVAQAAVEIPQSRAQFLQPKPSISVQPFLTTVRTTSNSAPTEILTTPPSTRPMDKSSTSGTEPLLVKLSPSQVAGSFQIIPGSIYNGQPVALYLAPTATLPTAPEYMTHPITNAFPTATTTTSTKSDALSIQMPQVVTAVVSPPSLDLLSPQAAAPAPTSLSGSTCFSHFSSSLPFSASVTTSSQNQSLLASTSAQPLPVSHHPQRIETGNPAPSFHANHIYSPESDAGLWRPW